MGVDMIVVTRFAPSPTGFLHIGNARTALFNYLFAKHHHGKFLLRIEDTDKERSTPEAIDAIYDGLKWLGIHYDQEAILQSSRAARHAAIAHELIARGKAYKCYHTDDELEALRQATKATGVVHRSKWRDVSEKAHPNSPYVVRLKVPLDGETVVNDLIQGRVVTKNSQIEDIVILRSDLTPVYMLAVVVDDHDMGVTHIIRGDDHLTNTNKQILLYEAMEWSLPAFAHIALIHGPDGAKLSKRHGALGVLEYKKLGYLPETMRNYLLRLGFSHGNDEIISDNQAVQWFDLKCVGKSPSRLDFKKIESLNGHYIKTSDNQRLYDLMEECYSEDLSFILPNLDNILDLLKNRAKTLVELIDACELFKPNLHIDYGEQVSVILLNNIQIINEYIADIKQIQDWNKEALMLVAKKIAEQHKLKLNDVAEALRAKLTGKLHAPSIFDIMCIIEKAETLRRLSS
jgi:glutamyl-tRNA synthetase